MSVENHVALPEQTARSAVDLIDGLSQDELYARLGQSALAARDPGLRPEDIVWRDATSFVSLGEFGERVFRAWLVALRNLLCGDGDEVAERRGQLSAAISNSDKPAAAAIVAAALTRYLGLDVGTSAAIGLLAYHVVLKPAGTEFCNTWQIGKLPEEKQASGI